MTNYKENPAIKIFPDLDKVVARFKEKGILKDPAQIGMYEAIAKNWCIGKAVIDVGCGIGVGTNVLAREAIGSFGIDINRESIKFAEQMFGNQKVKFEVADITKLMPRPIGTFDVVVAIELIEHVADFEAVLEGLKRFYEEKRRTVFFISSPNRNNDKIANDKPKNEYHVREWTSGEFYSILTKHFRAVVLYNGKTVSDFNQGETVDGNTKETPILAKCELPIFEEGRVV